MDHRREIVTPRLRIEALRPDHAPALWKAIESSLNELRSWMSWAEDASLANTKAFTEHAAWEWDEGVAWQFAIVVDDQPCGSLGLNRYDPQWGKANLGYWLRSDLCGQGLATEAASALVEFSFSDIGLHRLDLVAATTNYGSIRVAEKLGFTREGMMRDGSRAASGYLDTYIFGLLEDDERKRFH